MSHCLRSKPLQSFNGIRARMTTPTTTPILSYAQSVTSNLRSNSTQATKKPEQHQAPKTRRSSYSSETGWEQNQDHVPKTAKEDEDVYILAFRTDKALHQEMTALRKKYFPPERNKLASHLTLFHALPESKLKSDIYPAIEKEAASTSVFTIRVGEPRRMSKGFMLPIRRNHESEPGYACHSRLLEAWKNADFLSHQDTGKLSMHYTIMNFETEEEKIVRAMDEVKQNSAHPHGQVIGLDLYRYKPWGWTPVANWPFKAQEV